MVSGVDVVVRFRELLVELVVVVYDVVVSDYEVGDYYLIVTGRFELLCMIVAVGDALFSILMLFGIMMLLILVGVGLLIWMSRWFFRAFIFVFEIG